MNKDYENLLRTKISLFTSCSAKNPIQQLTFNDFLSKIKNETYKYEILKLRQLVKKESKTEYTSAKTKLQAVTLSGEFKNRDGGLSLEDKIINHSGLVQIDIDNIGTRLEELKNKLAKDPYLLFVFTSPSGNGLKCGLYLKGITPHQHNDKRIINNIFSQVQYYFKNEYEIDIDSSVKDIYRLCFVSFDPDLRVNRYLKPFKFSNIESKDKIQNSKPKLYSISNYENIIYEVEMGLAHDQDGTRHKRRYDHGLKIGTLIAQGFIDSSYKDKFDEYIRRNTEKPFSEAKQNFLNGIDQGIQNAEQYTMSSKKSGIKTNHKELPFCFWDVEYSKDKMGKSDYKSVKINQLKFIQFLKGRGFVWYVSKNNPSERFLVRVKNKIIKKTTVSQIQEYVTTKCFEELPDKIDYELTKDKIHEIFLKGIAIYINKEKLNALGSKEFEIQKDTKNVVYKPFRNGVCVIKADSINIISYNNINGFYWNTQVVDRKVNIITSNNEYNRILHKHDYHNLKVCMSTIKNEHGEELFDEEIKSNIDLSLGYLGSRYFDPTENKAIIITEDNLSHNPEGRSGKTLLVKAQQYLDKVIIIDGKNFKVDSPFKYQNVDEFTSAIVLDDVKADFDFESLFSQLTNGIEIEKKYQNKHMYEPEDSPKIVVTSNNALVGSSGSHKARKHLVEITPYFSVDFGPKDYFGRTLFYDWTDDEWNSFYNIKFREIQDYLKEGTLPEYSSETLRKRQLIADVGQDLLEYLESCFVYNEYHVKNVIREDVFEKTNMEFSSKKFFSHIESFCKINNYKYESDRKRITGYNSPQYVFKIVK